MATITKRQSSSGEVSWRAQVRVKKEGRIVYSKAKTFPTQKLAKDWASRLEMQLQEPGEIDRQRVRGVTLGDLIDKYLKDPEVDARIGRTKRYTLQLVQNRAVADKLVFGLVAADIIEHGKERKADGAGPATVAQDVSYIKSVLEYARLTLNLPVTGRIIDDGRQEMEKMNLVGKSQHRNRRPAADELEMMLAGLRERAQSGNGFIPAAAIVEFSIYSAMRISEVCRLRWDDVDEAARTVIIRQRKDPKKKAHNDQVVPLLGPAWDIAIAQPRIDERIFPYDPRSVSAAWQRVRAKLGIDDLRFHDLRHEGTSRLFELGYGIHEVSMVNGNRSWSSLKRYTNLKPSALHEKYDQLVAAEPAHEPQASPAKIKRRQWIVSTPDGWLHPVDGEIGFVDDESDAFGWPDEKSAQAALDSVGGDGEVIRVVR